MPDKLSITIDKVKVQPTHVAQICPVCNGWRTVKHGQLDCGACYDPETKRSRGFVLIPCEPVTNITQYGG